MSLEDMEKEIVNFIKSRGGKVPLVVVQKNISWTVDGREMIFTVIDDMKQRGILEISKNSFGIDVAYIKK